MSLVGSHREPPAGWMGSFPDVAGEHREVPSSMCVGRPCQSAPRRVSDCRPAPSPTPKPRPVPYREPGSLVPRKSVLGRRMGESAHGALREPFSLALALCPWPCVRGLPSWTFEGLSLMQVAGVGVPYTGSSPLLFRDKLVVVIGSQSCVAVLGPQ